MKEQTNPSIAIVMPTFNMADSIGDSIESVLQQTYTNWHLYVVDDCSFDTTKQAIQPYLKNTHISTTFLSTNQGKAAAVNTLLNSIKEPIITFLDADDILPKKSLEIRVKQLIINEKIGLVYGDIETIDQQGNRLRRLKAKNMPSNKLYHHMLSTLITPIFGPSIMTRTKIIKDINGFDKRLKRAQDLDLIIRILKHTTALYLDEIVLLYRVYKRTRKRIVTIRKETLRSWLHIIDKTEYTVSWKWFLKIKHALIETAKCSVEFITYKK